MGILFEIHATFGKIQSWMNGLFHCWQLRANERSHFYILFQLNICKELTTRFISIMSWHAKYHCRYTLVFNKNWFKFIITIRYAFRLLFGTREKKSFSHRSKCFLLFVKKTTRIVSGTCTYRNGKNRREIFVFFFILALYTEQFLTLANSFQHLSAFSHTIHWNLVFMKY